MDSVAEARPAPRLLACAARMHDPWQLVPGGRRVHLTLHLHLELTAWGRLLFLSPGRTDAPPGWISKEISD